ncbi:MAG TPA: M20/M25/M40 family metallo-hydrolase [Thermomicrobiales bacterium]|nr:M20/M25/M40 family metallo-hydrolase [Thermomicrobiales bacterium]
MSAAESLSRVLAACETNRERDLADLLRLLRQPSISAQNIGVAECAELVRQAVTAAGLAAELIPTARQPMVFGERPGPAGAPTLLLYGHYDVQPPDPLDAWVSPPFEPEIRDGRVYARGAGDNKGQFFAHLAALRAWNETIGDLPIGVKMLIEGEEETGSPHLDETVAAHRDRLQADLAVTSDGPIYADGRPLVKYGVRGMLYIELRAKGASRDLHSGNWGGIAPNPIWTLIHLLATMLDRQNRITVDGVLDGVREPPAAVRAALDALAADTNVEKTLATIGADTLPPPVDRPLHDRLMIHPTMNIAGLHGGYGGEGSKTVIPSEAVAKLDLRLVPDQDPDAVFAAVRDHVARHAPDVEIVRLGSMRPSATPLDHPLAAAVREAVRQGFGQEPVDVPSAGGSLPDAAWTRTLGLPSFVVPYANHDEGNHGPNENLVLDRFFAGIRTTATLLATLAGQE